MYVVQAVKVSGVPMYGYHPRQHTFVKVTLDFNLADPLDNLIIRFISTTRTW